VEGQHVGDAREMRLEQFNNVSFTYYRKKLINSKPEPVTVPLCIPLRVIVSELSGEQTSGRIWHDLPADQTMNYYLKEIAEHAGIDKKITLKTGRHTFATIFLENNPNPKVLQTLLGHSDIKQTMNYVHALERTKQRGIECFDKLIE
jgi:integrase